MFYIRCDLDNVTKYRAVVVDTRSAWARARHNAAQRGDAHCTAKLRKILLTGALQFTANHSQLEDTRGPTGLRRREREGPLDWIPWCGRAGRLH